MKKIFIIIFFLLAGRISWAQKSRIDSLLIKIDQIKAVDKLTPIENDLFATPQGAFALLKKAKRDLAIAEAAAAPEKEARALLMICDATFTVHDLPGLLDASLKGINISQRINNFYLCRFFHSAAMANAYAQDDKRSISYSLQAARIALAAGDTRQAITNYSNIESDYAGLKKPDSALFYARLDFALLARVKSVDKWDDEQTVFGDLGEAFATAGRRDSAFKYYRLAYNIALKHEQPSALPYMENNMARAFLDISEPDSAKKYALLSYNLAVKTRRWEFTADAATILAQVYEGKDYKQNAYYLKAEMAAKDSINAADKSRQFQLVAQRDQQRREDLKAEQDKYNTQMRFYAVIAAAFVLFIIGVLLWRNNRRQKQNNQLLSEQKEEIVAQRDHLGSALEKLKATQTQLIQSKKMASLGELTAGIAHEIQNPLNFVNNFSEVNTELIEEMQQEIENGDYEEVKALAGDIKENQLKINQHGKRADFIVKGMLQHSRTSTGERQETNINILADEFLKLSYHGLRAKDKSFNSDMITNFDENLPKVNVIQQDIGRVLLNLFNNAFYAVNQKMKTVAMHSSGAGDDYRPTVTVSTSSGESRIIIKVKDNGIGMPEHVKEKIMQPFFTTKPTGEGTGLGLSLTYDIVVKGHGGSIKVESKEGEGSEFIVTIPFI